MDEKIKQQLKDLLVSNANGGTLDIVWGPEFNLKKKAIITGVTGQDGSHMADLLIEKGYTVIGITRRTSTSNTQRINHLLNHPDFKLVEGDLTDPHSVLSILLENKDVCEIYNFAAQSHVGTSFSQPSLTFDITAKGVINILQAIVDLKLNCKFYQASSSEMFGKAYDEDENGKYQDENTVFTPQSPYGIAKLSAHHMVRLYRQSHGLFGVCGILFNHEGERRGEEFVTRKITKWIGKFVKWLKDNNIRYEDLSQHCLAEQSEILFASGVASSLKKLRLGNLDSYRDWGYAKDYVEAAHQMLQQEHPQDYVICSQESHTVREFLDEAFGLIGVPKWFGLVYVDPALYRPSEVDYLKGRSIKAQKELGWRPKASFKELVKIMVENDTKL